MKLLLKIILIISISFSFFAINTNSVNAAENINIGNITPKNNITNNPLDDLKNTQTDFQISTGGTKGIFYMLQRTAKDLKNIFFVLAGLFFVIIVIKLIFAENTEEEMGNFKKGIIWITVGLFITQVGYVFVNTFYDKGVSTGLANTFSNNILGPIINLMQTAASFFFIGIAIFAFYKLVTSNGNEDEATKGKMSIMYAIIGFIVVKLSNAVVETTYGKLDCSESSILGLITVTSNNCTRKEDLEGFGLIIVDIINWVNSMVGILVVILIIFAGAKILLSGGNEEKIKEAKNTIIYIAVGITVLIVNYLILTFFLLPEKVI